MPTNSTTMECDRDFWNRPLENMPEQIARAVCIFQLENTGHCPKAVSVVLGKDTLVITLHAAMTLAETMLASNAREAAKVLKFYHRLIAKSSESLRQDIRRITGRYVREAMASVHPTTWAMKRIVATGTIVQMFLLTPDGPPEPHNKCDLVDRRSQRVPAKQRMSL